MSHSGGVSSVCPLSSLHLWLQSSVCSLRRAVWHHIQNGRGAQCMLRENTHNNTLPEATFALCYSLGTVSLFWPKCYSFVHSLHKAGQTLVINNCLWIGTAGSILRGRFGVNAFGFWFSFGLTFLLGISSVLLTWQNVVQSALLSLDRAWQLGVPSVPLWVDVCTWQT